jgi:hypothetical protein
MSDPRIIFLMKFIQKSGHGAFPTNSKPSLLFTITNVNSDFTIICLLFLLFIKLMFYIKKLLYLSKIKQSFTNGHSLLLVNSLIRQILKCFFLVF